MSAAAKSAEPTAAEHDKAAVHEARAALAGREECTCKVCRKVAAALAERLMSV